MARVVGVDLPSNKRVEISLTYIYGIGRSRAKKIIKELSIDVNSKMKDLSEEQLIKIREYVSSNYKVEGDLRTEVAMDIKRLMEIGCYRGIRHRRSLPVRGQRTRTNAKMWKKKSRNKKNN